MRKGSKRIVGALVAPVVHERSEKVSTCEACGAKIIWALDDRFPEHKVGDLINVEPTKNLRSSVVLWYEVTEKGKPVGEQWFRCIDEGSDYAGDRWNRHLETCGGSIDVRPL